MDWYRGLQTELPADDLIKLIAAADELLPMIWRQVKADSSYGFVKTRLRSSLLTCDTSFQGRIHQTNTDWFTGFGELNIDLPTDVAVKIIAECSELLPMLKSFAETKANRPHHLELLLQHHVRPIIADILWDAKLEFEIDPVVQHVAQMLVKYVRTS